MCEIRIPAVYGYWPVTLLAAKIVNAIHQVTTRSRSVPIMELRVTTAASLS